MKKLITIASLLIAAASCTNINNEAVETISKQSPLLYCFTENNPLTKTSLSVDTDGIGTIYWKPEDCINVFFGTEKIKYYSTNEENATNVVFDTTEDLDGKLADFSNIWGLYPYNANAFSDGLSVCTTIPASQQCIDDSFDTDLFPMLAHSGSNKLHFKNICGGIKFSLSRDDIKTISFRGNNNEDIAGRIRVVMEDDGQPITSIESGEKKITLTPKGGDTFNSGVYYYIVILPCELTNGFTMTFETSEEIGTFIYNEKSISIKRSVFSKKNNIDSYASYKVIIPEGVVDMGLSVMWATCNIGATSPEEYGDYYAWGETETKTEYTWANYKWCNGKETALTKYNSSPSYGIVDNKYYLDKEDDVAYVKLGGRWRMPAPIEIEELVSNCTITREKYNEVDGYLYTSNINGNSIFFPLAGQRRPGPLYFGEHANYPSSRMYLGLYDHVSEYFASRRAGLPVRPVFQSDVPYERPENPADGIIDLGLSVKWRSRNLGAEFPEEYGAYFQWAGTRDVSDTSIDLDASFNDFPYGRSQGSTYILYKYNDGDFNGKTDYKDVLDDSDDAASVILGGGWHCPTFDEWDELIEKCEWTRICINGVGGYRIQSKVPGYTDRWLFLPAAGERHLNFLIDYETGNKICEYWSSSLGKRSVSAWVLYNGYRASEARYEGLPIRPVTSE